MDGRIFWVEKRTRGSTALKQCLTEDLILFKRNITYPVQFEIYRTIVRAKFWKRLEWNQFLGNSPVDAVFLKKLVRFQSQFLPKFGPNNCPVYLKLPWMGNISLKFGNKIKSSVKHCFKAVEPRVLFSTQKIHP